MQEVKVSTSLKKFASTYINES